MRLAAITGVNGVYTDEDIARIRALAQERLTADGAGHRRARRKRSAPVLSG
jgi:hypothetical protein